MTCKPTMNNPTLNTLLHLIMHHLANHLHFFHSIVFMNVGASYDDFLNNLIPLEWNLKVVWVNA
jgi:hypothetical protein